jgi:pyruvate/2-oxoglutarate dehydrogenase complex dihydrolipoamide dehydrogenase (E3) component
MRKLRSQISPHDSVQRFTGLGVDVFLGEGRFTSSNTLMVNGETLRFKKAIIATGARAVIPHIEGLEDQGYLTNESVFSLTERPDRLVVIGGGPIGCELAQAFQRLGSRVTLLESGSQFLAREEPDAAGLLADVFEREGIDVRLGAQVLKVTAGLQGEKVVHVEQNEATLLIPADQILVGVGRAPNIEELNLDGIGVRHDQGGILVDETLRTTNPSIYAAGDVCSSFKFTHTADFTARIAVQNALFPFLPRKKVTKLIIPWCTYTDPEIAHVGAYPRQLDQEGTPYQTITVSMGDVDRAILEGDSEGFLKIHAATHDGRILGATLVSRHAGEMISEITLAMNNGIKLSAIGNVIHPYPTQAEVIRKSADAWNRQRLTPGRKKVLERILRWLR